MKGGKVFALESQKFDIESQINSDSLLKPRNVLLWNKEKLYVPEGSVLESQWIFLGIPKGFSSDPKKKFDT